MCHIAGQWCAIAPGYIIFNIMKQGGATDWKQSVSESRISNEKLEGIGQIRIRTAASACCQALPAPASLL
jgi:hypothetical protein